MIAWTTPTIPILVRCSNADVENTRIVFTFIQGCTRYDIEPTSMERVTEGIKCLVDLTQLQTGAFEVGKMQVQANILSSDGYRAASEIKGVYVGENLIDEELSYE